ncbi:unnamed protein product [Arabidopsis thaliana]|uniref:FBD domain-containing protein n=1 Tax=Arabidopsis thaliana TaxID=3702 RepID=A0A654FPU0_ARATH|nr:unnamed protein product [Arabidopsis thaliana]
MPQLGEADIETTYPDINKFVTSITSVNRLSLCVRVNSAEELENLKLCPCDANWSKLLVRFLENSHNLLELEIDLNDDHIDSCVVDPLVCLENQLNYVPECLRSNLETKWTGMHGSQKEIDMLKYILRNACCLKTATILFKSTPDTEDKHKTMIQELLLSSTTCQLVFD